MMKINCVLDEDIVWRFVHVSVMSQAIMKPEKCQPVNADWLFGPEQVEHFLRYRRSIRNYKTGR